ncbi:hypothetical protein XA68_11267 [Ophiocordyceps unilateralis]|uniref:Uncharacterized protein n=1 Tax=Ophiocordyceps unilateralis TaxID=268505 RepID=A0A2A9PH77_OPHUN|nr:hypothetical protein XA68_11267 [Ophiocordyceps unilateralis]
MVLYQVGHYGKAISALASVFQCLPQTRRSDPFRAPFLAPLPVSPPPRQSQQPKRGKGSWQGPSSSDFSDAEISNDDRCSKLYGPARSSPSPSQSSMHGFAT